MLPVVSEKLSHTSGSTNLDPNLDPNLAVIFLFSQTESHFHNRQLQTVKHIIFATFRGNPTNIALNTEHNKFSLSMKQDTTCFITCTCANVVWNTSE